LAIYTKKGRKGYGAKKGAAARETPALVTIEIRWFYRREDCETTPSAGSSSPDTATFETDHVIGIPAEHLLGPISLADTSTDNNETTPSKHSIHRSPSPYPSTAMTLPTIPHHHLHTHRNPGPGPDGPFA